MNRSNQRLPILTSLGLVLLTATPLYAAPIRIDFSGSVSSILHGSPDSPLLAIGDAVSGTVFMDYPMGTALTASYVTPAGTSTMTGGAGRSVSSGRSYWILEGTGPSGTFNGLFYTLDGLVVSLPLDASFSLPPLADVLAFPPSAVGIQVEISQISTFAGSTVTSHSYAELELTSASISAVNRVSDSGSPLLLAGVSGLLLSLACRWTR